MSGEHSQDNIRSFLPALGVFFLLMGIALSLHVSLALAEENEIVDEQPRARLGDMQRVEKQDSKKSELPNSKFIDLLRKKAIEQGAVESNQGARLVIDTNQKSYTRPLINDEEASH